MTSDAGTLEPITVLHSLAAAHLADREEARRAAEVQAREVAADAARRRAAEAVELAVKHVNAAMPATLDQVLTADHWTGYTPRTDTDDWPESWALPPSVDSRMAVALVGRGLWVVFQYNVLLCTAFGELALLVPCPCSRYIELRIASDEHLADQLADVAAWQAAPLQCSGVCSPSTRIPLRDPDSPNTPW